MRGDRPYIGLIGLVTPRATPHARGSTFSTVRLMAAIAGYPACAGIDLAISVCKAFLIELPRMRGDRPVGSDGWLDGMTATPHARGSTHSRRRMGRAILGYPACAGIDPYWHPDEAATKRLPRMRGDRPIKEAGLGSGNLATPHARGSTCTRPHQTKQTSGYPACAGIDLKRFCSEESGLRLPRMRGDRP